MVLYQTNTFTLIFGDKRSVFCIPAVKQDSTQELSLQNKLLQTIQVITPAKHISMLNQVHGTEHCVLYSLEDAHNMPFRQRSGDALITAIPDNALAIATADCLPVAFYDSHKHACAVIHAGWKGLMAGIIEQTIVAMQRAYGINPASLQVFLGPSARDCCYEVSPEWAGQLREQTDKQALSAKNEALFFDLSQAAYHRLLKNSVSHENITQVDICTICSLDFWSYRRDKEQALRNVTTMALH